LGQRTRRLGDLFALARRLWEERWGCRNLEIPISWLADSHAYRGFAAHLLAEAPRFLAVHNQALAGYRARHRIRSTHHPVTALATDGDWHEVPFWAWCSGDTQRQRLFVRPGGTGRGPEIRVARAILGGLDDLLREGWKIRPRALTTTLFARLYLADLFVHGIGGAIYDELTDDLIRQFFGLEPPEFLVVSGTLYLPQPQLASGLSASEVKRRLRHIWFNPDRYLTSRTNDNGVQALSRQKQDLVAQQPEESDAKRARFHTIIALNERLRPPVAVQIAALQQELEQARRRDASKRVWQDRDNSFCLYPEDELRSWFAAL
jgi:hypothetical protein